MEGPVSLRASDHDLADVRYISRRCPRCKGSGKRIIRWVDEEIDEYGRAHAIHQWDVDECLLCRGAGDAATPMLPLGATTRLASRLAAALRDSGGGR